jgi:hypothetical protein
LRFPVKCLNRIHGQHPAAGHDSQDESMPRDNASIVIMKKLGKLYFKKFFVIFNHSGPFLLNSMETFEPRRWVVSGWPPNSEKAATAIGYLLNNVARSYRAIRRAGSDFQAEPVLPYGGKSFQN